MLYLIRHGQTDANLKQINAGGEWDLPLNSTGEQQARDFAAQNRAFLLTINKFYVSPMLRAQQTAHFIAETIERTIAKETIEDLREWKLGEWSGKPLAETASHFDERLTPPGGESFPDFQSRILNALNLISHKDDERALVVAHGGVWFGYADHAKHDRQFLDNCRHEALCRITLRAFK